jgi:hypothetical protein
MASVAPIEYATMVREATEADRRFVLDSWVKSYVDQAPMHMATYGMSRWDWCKRVAEWCVSTGRTVCTFMPDYPDAVLSWACGGKGVLHYVYTAGSVRRQGLAKELIAELGIRRGARITHRPGRGRGMRERAAALGLQWQPITLAEIQR